MVGVLGAVVLAVQATDYNAGIVLLTLGVATSALAGIVAALLAWKDIVATTALGKAGATFAQFLAAGLATVGFSTFADIVNFPHVALPLLAAAAIAALQSFLQNSAEATG
jgi:hypothetical protein